MPPETRTQKDDVEAQAGGGTGGPTGFSHEARDEGFVQPGKANKSQECKDTTVDHVGKHSDEGEVVEAVEPQEGSKEDWDSNLHPLGNEIHPAQRNDGDVDCKPPLHSSIHTVQSEWRGWGHISLQPTIHPSLQISSSQSQRHIAPPQQYQFISRCR